MLLLHYTAGSTRSLLRPGLAGQLFGPGQPLDASRTTAQPASLRLANVFHATATNGGTLALQVPAGTAERANAMVTERLAAPAPADANDFIWQWDSSRDHDVSAGLGAIRARVLAINSADDGRHPPETGVTEAALARIAGARLFLIPASAQSRGHGTTGMAAFRAEELRAFLAATPARH